MMVDVKLVFLCLVPLMLACNVDGKIFGGRFRGGVPVFGSRPRKGGFPHGIKTKSGLTKLLNSKVVKAKHVQRPLFGGRLGKLAAKYTPLKHTGVVVTTKKGKNLLVHKGSRYGKSSQTVVVNAKHMSNKWRGTGSKKVSGVRIKDYVKAGGKNYRLFGNNCQHASCRMFKLKG